MGSNPNSPLSWLQEDFYKSRYYFIPFKTQARDTYTVGCIKTKQKSVARCANPYIDGSSFALVFLSFYLFTVAHHHSAYVDHVERFKEARTVRRVVSNELKFGSVLSV